MFVYEVYLLGFYVDFFLESFVVVVDKYREVFMVYVSIVFDSVDDVMEV